MPLFLQILIIVYVLAVNFYGGLMLSFQKKAKEEDDEHPVSDAKILFSAVLGGATGILITMIITRYRLKSALFMIVIPLLIALNAYLVFFAVSSGIGYFSA